MIEFIAHSQLISTINYNRLTDLHWKLRSFKYVYITNNFSMKNLENVRDVLETWGPGNSDISPRAAQAKQGYESPPWRFIIQSQCLLKNTVL
jgi:hypothetical protein